MHEITLCQRALELIEQQAVQNHAKRVTGVWLKVGAFSCVETSALTFCFELVCRGTLAEGCALPYRRAAGGVLVRAVSAVRHAAVIEGTALSAVPEQRAAHRGG
jgi:Zn finger protein HypA/HybF involved in hydrogenase expression